MINDEKNDNYNEGTKADEVQGYYVFCHYYIKMIRKDLISYSFFLFFI